jgi:hypothetical protein
MFMVFELQCLRASAKPNAKRKVTLAPRFARERVLGLVVHTPHAAGADPSYMTPKSFRACAKLQQSDTTLIVLHVKAITCRS